MLLFGKLKKVKPEFSVIVGFESCKYDAYIPQSNPINLNQANLVTKAKTSDSD